MDNTVNSHLKLFYIYFLFTNTFHKELWEAFEVLINFQSSCTLLPTTLFVRTKVAHQDTGEA